MFLLSLIKKADYLGPTVQFTIRKESNFKTSFGGIVSILLILIYVSMFIYFGGEFYNRENPNVFSQINYPKPKEKLAFEINNENFQLAYYLHKGSLSYKDLSPDDFTIKAYHVEIVNITRLSKPKKTELSFTLCSESLNKTSSFKNFYSQIDNSNKKNLYCVQFPEYSENSYVPNNLNNYTNNTFVEYNSLKMQGSLRNFPFSFLNFKLLLKLNNKTCQKIDYLVNTTETENLNILPFNTLNLNFWPNNFYQPFFDKLGLSSARADLLKKRREIYKMDYHLLNNDDGYFLSNENKISRFDTASFGTVEQSVFDSKGFKDFCKKRNETYISEEKNVLLDLELHINDQYYYEYFRTYKKLQDFLGNVNGVMEVLKAFFYFAVCLYSNCRLDYFLINSNLNVRNSNNNNNNIIFNANNVGSEKIPKFENLELSILKVNNKTVNAERSKSINLQMQQSNLIINNSIADSEQKSSRKFSSNLNKLNQSLYKNNINFNIADENNFIKSVNTSKLNFVKIEEKELLEKIKKFTQPKKNFLSPNLLVYYVCCQKVYKNNHKKLLELKVLSAFSEKINNKLDILHYFKLIKKVKLLQKCFFKGVEQNLFFDILCQDLYSVNYRRLCEPKFFEDKHSHKKEILVEFYKNFFKENNYNDELMSKVFPSLLDELF